MSEERKENPMKRIAINLAHQMDTERNIHKYNDWDKEGIRQYGKEIRDEIWKKGYDVTTILHYAEEYKTLSMKDYMEWRYI